MIKKFNEYYKKELNYTKIPSTDSFFDRLERTRFTNQEYIFVHNIFSKMPNNIIISLQDAYKSKNNIIEIKPNTKPRIATDMERVLIYKFADEWFMVIVLHYNSLLKKSDFYKCDQLIGLKECLESIL